MDVSEVCKAKGATVHGVLVGHWSPVKESHGKPGVKYFEGKLNDGKKTLRIVGQGITNDCVYCVCVRSGNQQLYILS